MTTKHKYIVIGVVVVMAAATSLALLAQDIGEPKQILVPAQTNQVAIIGVMPVWNNPDLDSTNTTIVQLRCLEATFQGKQLISTRTIVFRYDDLMSMSNYYTGYAASVPLADAAREAVTNWFHPAQAQAYRNQWRRLTQFMNFFEEGKFE